MQRAEILELWGDYQNYWCQTGHVADLRQSGVPVRTPKLNPERYVLFEELHAWCLERELDPRLWLFALFRGRNWRFAPQLQRGHLLSAKFLAGGKYQKVLERGTLDGYRLYKKGAQESLDPNRDVIHAAEQKKRVWQKHGQSALCLAMIQSDSYGFHPKSKWCGQCTLKVECRTRLRSLVKFDIQALRRGEMTAEQARAQAGA